MTNPYQSPEPLDGVKPNAMGSPKPPNKKLRRRGWLLIKLGILAPILGTLFTAYGMAQTFRTMASSSAVNPVDMAEGISNALIATSVGVALAVVLIPVGILLLVRARRAE